MRRGARGLNGLIKYAATPIDQEKFIKISPYPNRPPTPMRVGEAPKRAATCRAKF